MLSFEFRLLPIPEVQPWGDSLRWYGFTDGEYWISVSGADLFRCADSLQGVEYYVVRLWEDVLDWLPHVLEPVPAELEPLIESAPESWTIPEDGSEEDDALEAMSWYHNHQLDTGYLRAAPTVCMFRTLRGNCDTVTITWRNPSDGPIRFLPPDQGRHTISTLEFLDAVTSFDHELMSAMAERVRLLQLSGGIPGVDLDMDQLVREQADRATWLARAREQTPNTNWEAVRRGAGTLTKE